MQINIFFVDFLPIRCRTLAIAMCAKTYEAINRCIYCGDDKGLFGDEHIIPFGLGGNVVLPKASCKRCEVITGRFEGNCLRTIMGHMRVKREMPTRRRKERPTKLPVIYLKHDRSIEKIDVPVKEHPTALVLMKFERARSLAGLPFFISKGLMGAPWFYGPTINEVTEMIAIRNRAGMAFGGLDPLVFYQMLAKIAHAFAVAELGLGSFTPTVTPLILGKSEDLGHYVGGSLDDPPPADADLHTIRWEGRSVMGRNYIVVFIRLFADLGAPIFHVVVGEASPEILAARASARALALSRKKSTV